MTQEPLDHHGFVGSYQRLQPRLLNELRSDGVSETDCEDILQESALRAWRSLASLEERSSFSGWFCTIARHVRVDFFRRRGTRLAVVSPEMLSKFSFGHFCAMGDSDDQEPWQYRFAWEIVERCPGVPSRIIQVWLWMDCSDERTALTLLEADEGIRDPDVGTLQRKCNYVRQNRLRFFHKARSQFPNLRDLEEAWAHSK